MDIVSLFLSVINVAKNHPKQFAELPFFDLFSVHYSLRIQLVDSFTDSFEKLYTAVGIDHSFDSVELNVDFHGPYNFLKQLCLVKFKSHVEQPVSLKLIIPQDGRINLVFNFQMQQSQVLLNFLLIDLLPISEFD